MHGIPFFGYHEYPECIWKKIFIHPRHAFGVLIQIAEFNADDWLSEQVKFPAGTHWELQKSETGTNLTFSHPGAGKVYLKLSRQELMQLISALEKTLSP